MTEMSLRERFCVESWHTLALCFLVLSRIKRKGTRETKESLDRQISSQAGKGRRVFVWISESNVFELGEIFRELEMRGLVRIIDGAIFITKSGRRWRSNRFELDAFLRWLEFQEREWRDVHQAKPAEMALPQACPFLQTFFM